MHVLCEPSHLQGAISGVVAAVDCVSILTSGFSIGVGLQGLRGGRLVVSQVGMAPTSFAEGGLSVDM